MSRQIIAFLVSSVALPAVAAVAFAAWGKPPSMIGTALLALVLLTAYCVGTHILRFPSRATIAGLLTGALLLVATMIVFDWALTHPEKSSPTLKELGAYLWLYRQRASVAFLISPFLLTLVALLAGKGITAFLARVRA